MNAWTIKESVKEIENRLNQRLFTQHGVVNVAKLIHMRKNSELNASVRSCDIVNIDGMGVVLGARFLGIDVPERVAGADLFEALIELSAANQYPVYLLGASDDVVNEARLRLEKTHPDLIVAGHYHGYFWEDEEFVVKKIQDSGARLLFVAITSLIENSTSLLHHST